MPDNEPELIRMESAARLASISRTKIYDLARSGEIPTVRIGSSLRVPRRRFMAWIEENTRGGTPTAA